MLFTHRTHTVTLYSRLHYCIHAIWAIADPDVSSHVPCIHNTLFTYFLIHYYYMYLMLLHRSFGLRAYNMYCISKSKCLEGKFQFDLHTNFIWWHFYATLIAILSVACNSGVGHFQLKRLKLFRVLNGFCGFGKTILTITICNMQQI